jgi:hypothetical protein
MDNYMKHVALLCPGKTLSEMNIVKTSSNK